MSLLWSPYSDGVAQFPFGDPYTMTSYMTGRSVTSVFQTGHIRTSEGSYLIWPSSEGAGQSTAGAHRVQRYPAAPLVSSGQ